MATYEEALSKVEQLLCERYNVRDVAVLAGLAAPLAAAREGDPSPLAEAVSAREMFRWAEPLRRALAEAATPSVGAEAPEIAGDNDNDTIDGPALETLEFKDIQAIAKDLGLKSVGVSRIDLIASIREHKPAQ